MSLEYVYLQRGMMCDAYQTHVRLDAQGVSLLVYCHLDLIPSFPQAMHVH
jgi:hypothetical protein